MLLSQTGLKSLGPHWQMYPFGRDDDSKHGKLPQGLVEHGVCEYEPLDIAKIVKLIKNMLFIFSLQKDFKIMIFFAPI